MIGHQGRYSFGRSIGRGNIRELIRSCHLPASILYDGRAHALVTISTFMTAYALMTTVTTTTARIAMAAIPVAIRLTTIGVYNTCLPQCKPQCRQGSHSP